MVACFYYCQDAYVVFGAEIYFEVHFFFLSEFHLIFNSYFFPYLAEPNAGKR